MFTETEAFLSVKCNCDELRQLLNDEKDAEFDVTTTLFRTFGFPFLAISQSEPIELN
jgi:hypothetical protein